MCANGTIAGDVVIPMGVLGDTSGNGTANGSDVSQTKAHLGSQLPVRISAKMSRRMARLTPATFRV